ncbi:hypothetical protein EGT74_24985 [Chitinophaga lutea]|uniref:WGR domain-containing protein n=1 Tax=Chitinophaga lutea TaxID=2488634 RepID=A0A3N4Q1J3_9BACT|nr:hypothetical protein [Chitinophaga lutea]RPE05634.1 hypothetical protein EGT74_24985 [Chitinophaga lutea]
MLKLYTTIDEQLYYWETWEQDEKTAIIHWGMVGDKGDYREIKSRMIGGFNNIVQAEIDRRLEEGYAEWDEDEQVSLEIEYKVDGSGTEADLDKRHRLEEKLDEVLGWTGLGHCDGGSTGSGTMEVACRVVDFNIARQVIEENLKDTEFADYTRIFSLQEE